MTFKFKRYKVTHKGKTYDVLVPDGIKDNIWIRDWADWWYASFITGSLRALKILAACFAVLGFNPYVIIYLPVGNDKIVNGLSGNPENGIYDMVFRTNRVQLKDSGWKAVRQKLKKAKWTTYKLKYDAGRLEKYFKSNAKHLEKVPQDKILQKAGAATWLAVGTAFFSYPKAYYLRESIELWTWIREELSDDKNRRNYDRKRDIWTCDMCYFCYGGYQKAKYTHEKPGCSLCLEMFDMDIANRYLKEKQYLVPNTKTKPKMEGISAYTYAGTNYFKISI